MKFRAGALLFGQLLFTLLMAFAMFDTSLLRWFITVLKEQAGFASPKAKLYGVHLQYGAAVHKSRFGHPNIDVVMVVLCSLYFCAFARQEDEESLRSARPVANTHFGVRVLWEVAFSIRFILQPLFTLTAASFIMVGSDDALDIILNVLGFVFLFDLDNALYFVVLGDGERETWETSTSLQSDTQTADMPESAQQRCAQALFMLSVSAMAWAFKVNIDHASTNRNPFHTLQIYYMLTAIMVCRCAFYEVACVWGQVTRTRSGSISSVYSRMRLISSSLLTALLRVLARSIFVSVAMFPTETFLAMYPAGLDTESPDFDPELWSCIVQGDSSACQRSQ